MADGPAGWRGLERCADMAGLCIWPRFCTLRLCESPKSGEPVPVLYEAISLCMLVVRVNAETGRTATPLPELDRGRLAKDA